VPNLIIRNVSPEIISALDTRASRLGLSRVEFLRRTLIREALVGVDSVDESHLASILELLPDLTNEVIVHGAWE
jgi:plasmid stability protein